MDLLWLPDEFLSGARFVSSQGDVIIASRTLLMHALGPLGNCFEILQVINGKPIATCSRTPVETKAWMKQWMGQMPSDSSTILMKRLQRVMWKTAKQQQLRYIETKDGAVIFRSENMLRAVTYLFQKHIGINDILAAAYGEEEGGQIATYVVGSLLGYRLQDIRSYLKISAKSMRHIQKRGDAIVKQLANHPGWNEFLNTSEVKKV